MNKLLKILVSQNNLKGQKILVYSVKGLSTKPKKKSKKKQTSPMTAAGLIAFYEDYDSKIEISPMTLIIISVVVALIVIFARII